MNSLCIRNVVRYARRSGLLTTNGPYHPFALSRRIAPYRRALQQRAESECHCPPCVRNVVRYARISGLLTTNGPYHPFALSRRIAPYRRALHIFVTLSSVATIPRVTSTGCITWMQRRSPVCRREPADA